MSQAARLAHWIPTYSPAVGDVVSAAGAPNANNVVTTAFSAIGAGGGGASPATVPPLMDGVAAVGASSAYARGDHVHPSDTSRVAKAGDTMTGALVSSANITGRDMTANRGDGSGYFAFGTSGAKYLGYEPASNLYTLFGARLNVQDTTASSSSTTGALTVGGGVGVAGDVQAGGVVTASGVALNSTSGPQVSFFKSGVLQSLINDNGTSINVFSNAGATAGMYIAHGASAWTAISDARLPYKRTARPLSALDKLESVQLYENEVDGRLELFGKAQEIFEAFPHVVIKGDDDATFTPTGMFDGKIWGVSYERLGLVALQACKELLAQVQALEDRIATLEAAK
jgi:hypothetical protein